MERRTKLVDQVVFMPLLVLILQGLSTGLRLLMLTVKRILIDPINNTYGNVYPTQFGQPIMTPFIQPKILLPPPVTFTKMDSPESNNSDIREDGKMEIPRKLDGIGKCWLIISVQHKLIKVIPQYL